MNYLSWHEPIFDSLLPCCVVGLCFLCWHAGIRIDAEQFSRSRLGYYTGAGAGPRLEAVNLLLFSTPLWAVWTPAHCILTQQRPIFGFVGQLHACLLVLTLSNGL